MGKYSEAFIAFDVAKKEHAVAIAEGGRQGEVRFLGDVANGPLPIERTIKCKTRDLTVRTLSDAPIHSMVSLMSFGVGAECRSAR